MHRRHSDSRTFQTIRRCRHSRSKSQLTRLRHLTHILTMFMRRRTTLIILTILITIHIFQLPIFTVRGSVSLLAIPLNTAITATIRITAGIAEPVFNAWHK